MLKREEEAPTASPLGCTGHPLSLAFRRWWTDASLDLTQRELSKSFLTEGEKSLCLLSWLHWASRSFYGEQSEKWSLFSKVIPAEETSGQPQKPWSVAGAHTLDKAAGHRCRPPSCQSRATSHCVSPSRLPTSEAEACLTGSWEDEARCGAGVHAVIMAPFM